jgi:hypothetical protein
MVAVNHVQDVAAALDNRGITTAGCGISVSRVQFKVPGIFPVFAFVG